MLGHLKLLIKTCERLNLKCDVFHKNCLVVYTPAPHYFINCATPFNSDTFNVICKRKHLTYAALKDHVSMPHTLILENKKGEKMSRETIEKALASFTLPVIVKMDDGKLGQNVSLCRDVDQVQEALQNIFGMTGTHRQKIALLQEYIPIKKEYRVIVLENEIIFAYEKQYAEKKFAEGYGPAYRLHETAVLVTEPRMLEKMNLILKTVYAALPIEFAGVDIIENENGDLFLIELNTYPAFSDFIRDCGDEKMLLLYEKMLARLMEKDATPTS